MHWRACTGYCGGRCVLDNDAVEEKPGGLRNTIYDQQTRSGTAADARPAVAVQDRSCRWRLSLLRLVWRWCARGARDRRASTSRQRSAQAPSFIPVYWHQHQLFCVKHLFEQRRAGLKLGFLISPSVDGEFGAMIVRSMGGEVIRGSSTHTGARALRDFYQALAHEGVSPAITAGWSAGTAAGSSNRARCCWRSSRSGR